MPLDEGVRHSVQKIVSRFNDCGDRGGLSVVIDLATLIASADGLVDDAEVAAIGETVEILLGEHLGMDVVRRFVATSRANVERVGVQASAQSIGALFATHQLGREGVTLAAGIALASEGICERERNVIDWIASSAGVAGAETVATIEKVQLTPDRTA